MNWMSILVSEIGILLMFFLHHTIENAILKCGELFKSIKKNHSGSYDLLCIYRNLYDLIRIIMNCN